MGLPGEIRQQIVEALAAMRADPQHHLAPALRRVIYASFSRHTDNRSKQARGWLAVLTAQRVLPCWSHAFPDDTLPQELLTMAIAILQGTGDDKAAAELQDLGYHAAGNAWGYAEEDVPWDVNLAGTATYHALKEARGFQPLMGLENYRKVGTVVLPTESNDATRGVFIPQDSPLTGDQFTDEDLCQIDNADTASVAAVATACGPNDPHCNPSQLQEFWEWWLLEAIPAAWVRSGMSKPL